MSVARVISTTTVWAAIGVIAVCTSHAAGLAHDRVSFTIKKETMGSLPATPTRRISSVSGDNWFNDGDDLSMTETHINRDLPAHKQVFCAEKTGNFISRRIVPMGYRSGRFVYETLYFNNPPGPINAGMCWLHSRLQRQFTYLALFRPDLPKPSVKEANLIIKRIVNREGVTEIPGYSTLFDFSHDYEKQLLASINSMGWKCVANPNDCLVRVTDSYAENAQDLQMTMTGLYERMLKQPGDIQFVRTRVMQFKKEIMKTFIAHSLLVLDMTPIRGEQGVLGPIEGFSLRVIDPNDQSRVERVDYRFGDRTLTAGGWQVTPYTHYAYDGDIPQMNRQIEEYCRQR